MNERASYGAVLFDMGGVLLDMANAASLPEGKLDWRGRQALLAYLRRHGAKVDLEDIDELLFQPWREEYEQRYQSGREADWRTHLKRLRHELGVRSHDLTLLGTWFEPYSEQVTAMPSARPVVSTLAGRGIALGIVSNVPLPGRLYEGILARYGLLEPFATRRFSYDEGSRKPSPSMVRSALATLGVPPSRAMMVGDRRAMDVAAGRAAGVTTVWLSGEDGDGPDPDAEIRDLPELLRLL